MVGLDGVEPSTSRLSGVRSNQAELQAPDYFGLRPAMNPSAVNSGPNCSAESIVNFGFI